VSRRAAHQGNAPDGAPSTPDIGLPAAQSLVEQYAARAGAIRFDGPILDRDTTWFFPVGYIGSSGVIVEKATGRLHVIGSGQPLEEAFWAHEHGFSRDRLVLRILRIHDRRTTIELLFNALDDGPPRRRNPNPRRAWFETVLEALPHELAPQSLVRAAPALRQAAEQGWFEYQIVEATAEGALPTSGDSVDDPSNEPSAIS
jgi:hypothetical protein